MFVFAVIGGYGFSIFTRHIVSSNSGFLYLILYKVAVSCEIVFFDNVMAYLPSYFKISQIDLYNQQPFCQAFSSPSLMGLLLSFLLLAHGPCTDQPGVKVCDKNLRRATSYTCHYRPPTRAETRKQRPIPVITGHQPGLRHVNNVLYLSSPATNQG